MITRAEALAVLRRLAVGINEPTDAEAVERLLERVATAEPEARAALLELGARGILVDADSDLVWVCETCRRSMQFVGWHCRYCCTRPRTREAS